MTKKEMYLYLEKQKDYIILRINDIEKTQMKLRNEKKFCKEQLEEIDNLLWTFEEENNK